MIYEMFIFFSFVGHKSYCQDKKNTGELMLEDIRKSQTNADVENSTLQDITTPDSSAFNRIVGGQETTIEEHPYQASMHFIHEDMETFCGGFIISENYVLTAAHCAYNATPALTVLRVGSTFVDNGTVVPVAEMTTHPDYNEIHYGNDVTVVRTGYPITFGKKIRPIPLAPLGRPIIDGTHIVVAGWGNTRYGATFSPTHLRKVEIPVVSYLKCYLSYFYTFTENEFCAGDFYLGGMGSCQGDSGGAAVQSGMAVGIVSYGRGCVPPLSPSVFTNIAAASIRQFIYEETGL